MKIQIKKLKENAVIPSYGSLLAAGADLYNADGELDIPPHSTIKVGTGLAFELPSGYAGLIYARSGLATKKGLAPANKVGICDEDYRGEYIIALHNDTDDMQHIEAGERIAQLFITPYVQAEFEIVDELSQTVRGEGGFGSSGNK